MPYSVFHQIKQIMQQETLQHLADLQQHNAVLDSNILLLSATDPTSQFAKLAQQERELQRHWGLVEKEMSDIYIKKQLALDLEIEKRQQINRLETKLLDLWKMKEEKLNHISNFQKKIARRQKDIDYSLQLPTFQKQLNQTYSDISNSQYQLLNLKTARRDLIQAMENKASLEDLKQILHIKERNSAKKISKIDVGWTSQAQDFQETFRMGVSKVYEITKTRIMLSDRIRNYYLVRCKIGLNLSLVKLELSLLSQKLKNKSAELAMLERHNFNTIDTISSNNLQTQIYKSINPNRKRANSHESALLVVESSELKFDRRNGIQLGEQFHGQVISAWDRACKYRFVRKRGVSCCRMKVKLDRKEVKKEVVLQDISAIGAIGQGQGAVTVIAEQSKYFQF